MNQQKQTIVSSKDVGLEDKQISTQKMKKKVSYNESGNSQVTVGKYESQHQLQSLVSKEQKEEQPQLSYQLHKLFQYIELQLSQLENTLHYIQKKHSINQLKECIAHSYNIFSETELIFKQLKATFLYQQVKKLVNCYKRVEKLPKQQIKENSNNKKVEMSQKQQSNIKNINFKQQNQQHQLQNNKPNKQSINDKLSQPNQQPPKETQQEIRKSNQKIDKALIGTQMNVMKHLDDSEGMHLRPGQLGGVHLYNEQYRRYVETDVDRVKKRINKQTKKSALLNKQKQKQKQRVIFVKDSSFYKDEFMSEQYGNSLRQESRQLRKEIVQEINAPDYIYSSPTEEEMDVYFRLTNTGNHLNNVPIPGNRLDMPKTTKSIGSNQFNQSNNSGSNTSYNSQMQAITYQDELKELVTFFKESQNQALQFLNQSREQFQSISYNFNVSDSGFKSTLIQYKLEQQQQVNLIIQKIKTVFQILRQKTIQKQQAINKQFSQLKKLQQRLKYKSIPISKETQTQFSYEDELYRTRKQNEQLTSNYNSLQEYHRKQSSLHEQSASILQHRVAMRDHQLAIIKQDLQEKRQFINFINEKINQNVEIKVLKKYLTLYQNHSVKNSTKLKEQLEMIGRQAFSSGGNGINRNNLNTKNMNNNKNNINNTNYPSSQHKQSSLKRQQLMQQNEQANNEYEDYEIHSSNRRKRKPGMSFLQSQERRSSNFIGSYNVMTMDDMMADEQELQEGRDGLMKGGEMNNNNRGGDSGQLNNSHQLDDGKQRKTAIANYLSNQSRKQQQQQRQSEMKQEQKRTKKKTILKSNLVSSSSNKQEQRSASMNRNNFQATNNNHNDNSSSKFKQQQQQQENNNKRTHLTGSAGGDENNSNSKNSKSNAADKNSNNSSNNNSKKNSNNTSSEVKLRKRSSKLLPQANRIDSKSNLSIRNSNHYNEDGDTKSNKTKRNNAQQRQQLQQQQQQYEYQQEQMMMMKEIANIGRGINPNKNKGNKNSGINQSETDQDQQQQLLSFINNSSNDKHGNGNRLLSLGLNNIMNQQQTQNIVSNYITNVYRKQLISKSTLVSSIFQLSINNQSKTQEGQAFTQNKLLTSNSNKNDKVEKGNNKLSPLESRSPTVRTKEQQQGLKKQTGQSYQPQEKQRLQTVQSTNAITSNHNNMSRSSSTPKLPANPSSIINTNTTKKTILTRAMNISEQQHSNNQMGSSFMQQQRQQVDRKDGQFRNSSNKNCTIAVMNNIDSHAHNIDSNNNINNSNKANTFHSQLHSNSNQKLQQYYQKAAIKAALKSKTLQQFKQRIRKIHLSKCGQQCKHLQRYIANFNKYKTNNRQFMKIHIENVNHSIHHNHHNRNSSGEPNQQQSAKHNNTVSFMNYRDSNEGKSSSLLNDNKNYTQHSFIKSNNNNNNNALSFPSINPMNSTTMMSLKTSTNNLYRTQNSFSRTKK